MAGHKPATLINRKENAPQKLQSKIFAYKLHADFVKERIRPLDIENAIIDKLGKNDIIGIILEK